MDANTEYWQERLQQLEFDHEVECERLRARIAVLEDALSAALPYVEGEGTVEEIEQVRKALLA